MVVLSVETFKAFVSEIAELAVNFLELLSIGIIVYTTFVAFYKLLRKQPGSRIYLLHGQSVGLTFKLGSEILRTITVRNMDEILQIALLIAIKAAMTWLIHWELRDVEEEQEALSGKESFTDKLGKMFKPQTTVIVQSPAQVSTEEKAGNKSKNGKS
jgi:uncharacterized membrane protein